MRRKFGDDYWEVGWRMHLLGFWAFFFGMDGEKNWKFAKRRREDRCDFFSFFRMPYLSPTFYLDAHDTHEDI